MAAGRGDFEGALDVFLSADFAEVGVINADLVEELLRVHPQHCGTMQT